MKGILSAIACGLLQQAVAKIKVHIVSHSHMDAGWLSTFDEYYNDWVKRILTSVTQKLHKNP